MTVVLVGVNILVQAAYYDQLLEARRTEWSEQLKEQERLFLETFALSGSELQKLASQYAYEVDSFSKGGGAATSGAASAANTYTDVDALQFISRTGAVIFSWHSGFSQALPPTALTARAVKSVIESNRPHTYLDCPSECWRHAFLPIRTPGGREIIISTSRHSGNAILEFNKVARADILQLAYSESRATAGSAVIPSWNRRIVEGTHLSSMEPFMAELARQESLDTLRAGLTKWVDGQFLLITAFDLPAELTNGLVTIVVVKDETAGIKAMRQAAFRNFALGVFGIALAGLLFAIALGRPMRKLQGLAAALPMLAENRFAEVHDAIGRQMDKGGTTDEIDLLQQVSLQLTSRLEALQSQVARHTTSLQLKLAELRNEREFSGRLLDTAPIVILLHAAGRVLRMNKHGHALTGWPEDGLVGKAIGELIELPGTDGDIFQKLRTEDSPPIQTESGFFCADGEKLKVVWLHSRIKTEDGFMVMSVGLDLTRQRETETRLRWLSMHDSVTELLSRDGFTVELWDALKTARDERATAALLIFDIDHFKDINDVYGHLGGNEALKLVGGQLQQIAGTNALVGRLGSDEFAIFLPAANKAGAQRMAENICSNIAGNSIQFEGQSVHLSVTAGYVLFPEHGDTSGEIMANATLALAQAKRINPGNPHALTLDTTVRAARRERMHMRDEIAEALSEDRFVLHFQPILDMRSRRISHCEALVRMHDREGRIISPASFIQIAEESGQINAISHVVLRKAIQTQADLQRDGHRLKIGINLAAKTFEDPGLLALVRKLLQETGADPKCLIFEVVESEAIANLDVARSINAELTALGASFAFDDFGVGFTSFEYLRVLPVEYVKIDQSFIRHLHEKETDRLLVHSMNDMIQRLHLKSVAEGVENARTLEILGDIGVDYCQGYHISRPRPQPPVGEAAEAIERRLASEAAGRAGSMAMKGGL